MHLRSRGCSWNTVSTYLRTFRAVYNRAVDLGKAPYVPHLFRSVYTGTRTDHKRALCDEDMKKVFAKLSRTSDKWKRCSSYNHDYEDAFQILLTTPDSLLQR